jgi:uncharacterized protein YbaR (Trm112 family)
VHLLLTDRLACPRCGPGFGLVLRADRLESRVVIEGVLGCPNCRDAFPVVRGFADLRAPPRGAFGPGLAGAPGDQGAAEGAHPTRGGEVRVEGASRLLALLGVVGGPGTVALVGAPARSAAAVAAALSDLQVVAIDPDMRLWPEAPGVSRMVAAPGLPFFDAQLRAVALDGRLGEAWLDEAVRVVAPRGRVVVTGAGTETSRWLARSGLSVLALERGTIVAARG